MPIEDLKPLYDSAIQCKECQLQLATAQADLKDEQAKTATTSRELTDALRASKGGSVVRRVARAATVPNRRRHRSRSRQSRPLNRSL